MKQEKEASGKTVEAAILNGARELGVDRSLVTYEILEMPKKGFLGFGEVPAKVRVIYEYEEEKVEEPIIIEPLKPAEPKIARPVRNERPARTPQPKPAEPVKVDPIVPAAPAAKPAPAAAERVKTEVGKEISEDGDPALDFVRLLIKDMELEATASMFKMTGNARLIRIDGDDAGILIGHHGETLDSFQYLVNLVANKCAAEARRASAAKADGEDYDADEDIDDDSDDEAVESTGKRARYSRITVDIEDYRAKREDTLRELARRMAQKVLKYKKSVTLEPMSPYERRIIHSEIQEIEGVTTSSVGTENNRRVVVYIDSKEGRPEWMNNRRRRTKPAPAPAAAVDKDGND